MALCLHHGTFCGWTISCAIEKLLPQVSTLRRVFFHPNWGRTVVDAIHINPKQINFWVRFTRNDVSIFGTHTHPNPNGLPCPFHIDGGSSEAEGGPPQWKLKAAPGKVLETFLERYSEPFWWA